MRVTEDREFGMNRGKVVSAEPGALSDPILKLRLRHGEFAVEPGCHPFWTVIRKEHRPEGCRLTEGDVIRLGRTVFRVKQFSTTAQFQPYLTDSALPSPMLLYDPGLGTEPQYCRVCLQDFQTSQNPLISPCQCIGSMKYMHVNCLQTWMQSKVNVTSTASAKTYLWRRMECELCQAVLPTTISLGDEVKDLLNISTPSGPYVILEDLRSAGQVTRGLHVIQLSEDACCRLGRSQDCEVYVSDVSVTRFHACIRLRKGGFYLEDLGSKFGTAVKTLTRLGLPSGLTATIQTNQAVFTITIKTPFRIRRFLCCFESSEQAINESIHSSVRADAPKHMDTNSGRCDLYIPDIIDSEKLAFGDPGSTQRRLEDDDAIPTPDFR